MPYLDLFSQLELNSNWESALRKSDGLHPNYEGYVMMAAMIGEWSGWRDLFDG